MMIFENPEYISERQKALDEAVSAVKTKLVEFKAVEMFSGQQIIDNVPEVAGLIPLTEGEIQYICNACGMTVLDGV